MLINIIKSLNCWKYQSRSQCPKTNDSKFISTTWYFSWPHTKLSMSTKSPPPLTNWELVKMAAPIVLFGILLPTVDNYTDLRLIIRLYTGVEGCVNVRDLPWQKVYTCQEDPVTYCKSNPSWKCDKFERYGDASDIVGCKEKWQNEWTCQEDPATYCKSNPNSTGCQEDPATYCKSNPYSTGCHYFERYGLFLNGLPGCVQFSCQSIYDDPTRFCAHLPTSPYCGHFKHTSFATMFLGIICSFLKIFSRYKYIS